MILPHDHHASVHTGEPNMKKLFLFVTFLMLIAGWALAAASLHVVRTTGPIPKVGGLALVPKDRLAYRETYVDVSTWTDDQLAAHPSLGRKLTPHANRQGEHASQLDAGTFSLLTK
jgi:hypothetical protein